MRRRDDPKTPVTDVEESFLSRWSRRKREIRDEEARDLEPVSVATPQPAAAQTEADEAPRFPTDSDLPPLETLGENDDYSGFLSPKVSESLRRKALRQLFAGSQFHIRDGLDDYDDDYRTFESLGGLFTADMRHRMEVEAKRTLEVDRVADEAAPQPAAAPPTEQASADESEGEADYSSDQRKPQSS